MSKVYTPCNEVYVRWKAGRKAEGRQAGLAAAVLTRVVVAGLSSGQSVLCNIL